jgi:5-methyltetrahydrofolate--homocysteine methyltransferase
MLDGRILLDGGMGTALLARGLAPDALPEEWVLSRPDDVAAVHAEHAGAGARILLTCTFSCAAPRLEARVDPARIDALCGWAERLARSSARGGLVAGALGPTGLAAPGAAAASRALLASRYAPPVSALCAAGVDLLWLESQHDLGEALAALGVARGTGRPAVVTFTFVEAEGRLRTRDGIPAEECLAAVEAEGAAAAGANCVEPDAALASLAAWAAGRLQIPFVAKPTAGLPGKVRTPDAFAAAMRPVLQSGVRIAGGCCGATGDHLRALGAAMAV